MALDVSTLIFAGGAVAFSSGFFMLCYWALDRTAWSAFWWALANCGSGCCIMLFPYRAAMPPYIGMIVPQVLNLCAVQVFVAARIFNRGSINPYPITGAMLAWITGRRPSGQSSR